MIAVAAPARAARVVAVGLLTAALALHGTTALAHGASGWSRPVVLGGAGAPDESSLQVAAAGSGAAAAAFTVSDADAPGTQHAWLAPRFAHDQARPIGGAAQVLALAYRGSSLRLLTGSTVAGLDCCSTAATATVGAAARARPLLAGLAGVTQGRLIALGSGRMLAALATERGVWTAQTGADGVFGGARPIALSGQEPTVMDAAGLGGARSLVAWAAGTGTAGMVSPGTIDVAEGTIAGAPSRGRTLIALAPGHRVDELSVLRHGTGATLAWVESWTDRHGFHSRVEVADLASGHPRARALSPADVLASGLSGAGDPTGDEAVAWQACRPTLACTIQAAGRGSGHGFGSARVLGVADATSPESLAISPAGQVIVGWIRGGQAVASVGFGAPTTLSTAPDAEGIDVAYATRAGAFAAWSQGTLTPKVVGARYAAG